MTLGRKRPPPAEIDVGDLRDLLTGSREFLRMWARPNGPVTCLIDTAPIGPDPFALGIALVDCVRHGAKAYARATGAGEAEALARIWAGVDAERASPTDLPTDLSHDGATH